MQNRNIDKIIERINYFEKEVEQDCSPKNAQLLIAHYNKAIEYYATFNDDQHMEWLVKLQMLFKNEKIQKAMEVEDVGATAELAGEQKMAPAVNN